MERGEIKCEIVQKIAVLGRNETGWTMELNLVSWNERTPKFDIRPWAPGHDRMAKGVTLTKDELNQLSVSLLEYLKT